MHNWLECVFHSKEQVFFGLLYHFRKVQLLHITELSEAFLRGRRGDTDFSLVHSVSHRSKVDFVASLAVSTLSFSDWDSHYIYQKLTWILTQIRVCKVKKPEFWYGAWYYQIITFFSQFTFSQQLSSGYMKMNWLKLALKCNNILVLWQLIKAVWHHRDKLRHLAFLPWLARIFND